MGECTVGELMADTGYGYQDEEGFGEGYGNGYGYLTAYGYGYGDGTHCGYGDGKGAYDFSWHTGEGYGKADKADIIK